jgi:glycosyltransferase involved in cell wall biosynthesis
MSKQNKKKLLSVIIPTYKKEDTIEKDLVTVDKILKEGLSDDYDHEIICVIDGDLDNSFKNAKKAAKKSKSIKVYLYKVNRGKGYAVRYGMGKAKGDLISFLDAGMEISPKGIMMLLAHMDWYDADIIVGSKRHPVSRVNYPLKRKIISVGYHWVTKIMFRIKLTDTQSGIKIFKRNVVDKILPRLLVKRYAMDIEMLAVANYLGFKRIFEGPIELTFDKSTSSIKWSTIFHMLWDTIAVFYRLRIMDYYNDKNRKNWIY